MEVNVGIRALVVVVAVAAAEAASAAFPACAARVSEPTASNNVECHEVAMATWKMAADTAEAEDSPPTRIGATTTLLATPFSFYRPGDSPPARTGATTIGDSSADLHESGANVKKQGTCDKMPLQSPPILPQDTLPAPLT